jgi:hypothetical protein
MIVSKSMMAGLVATGVLSVVILLVSLLPGVTPALVVLNVPKLIAAGLGLPEAPLLGWTMHFLTGVVIYGSAMAALSSGLAWNHHVGKHHVGRGLLVGVAGWILMMVWLMPVMGAGLFGIEFGFMTPVLTLALHLLFGGILGWVDGRMTRRDDSAGPAIAARSTSARTAH